MNNSFHLFLLCLAFLASLLSCRTLKEPEYRGIENLRLNQLGISESTLSLEMMYFNPNKTNLKLKKAEGDAYLNDTYLGHFRIDTLIRLACQKDFSIPVKLVVDMKNILKNSMSVLLNPSVTLKLDGKAKMGKGFIYFYYPIRHEGEYNFIELLR